MDIRRLQKSAAHHRHIAETVEEPRLAKTHREVSAEIDGLIDAALTHNARLDQLRQR